MTAGDLAALVEGDLDGDASILVNGVAPLTAAEADDLVFAVDRARLTELAESRCAAALVPTALLDEARKVVAVPLIGVDDPRAAVARVLDRLYPPQSAVAGVHPAAAVADSALLDEGVGVAAGAVVEEAAHLGRDTTVGPGAYVGRGVRLGESCVVHANVTLYDGTRIGDRVVIHAGAVIGADGFGFARDEAEGQLKIPQVGGVRIDDDVEIGANACIDRGTLGDTRIGAGSKIDNLVQIGHNCRVGRNCALSGLSGLAGSTVLEDGVIMGGNAGTAGHQVIGANSMIAAKAGVHGDLEPGSVVAGYPQMDISTWRRTVGALAKLPDMLRRLRRLERRVDAQSEE